MDVHVAYGLFLILDLVSHGISVPVFPNYYDSTQNQGYQVSNDVTETGSYERFPRDVLSSPYFWQQYRWFPRSLIPSRPRQAHRRHFHLYHLTSKHPNAVSYHVIEKPHATRTINSRHRVRSNQRQRSNVYNKNNGAVQSYPAQSYYQQPYQYSGYPAGYGSSSPQTQYGVQNGGGFHDSTYDDLLQQVSKPLDHPNQAYVGHHSSRQNIEQNDQAPTSIEEAAKQFKLASADMSNMELASLVMYPLPRFLIGKQPKVHKKKSKQKHKKYNKKVKAQKPKLKVEDETNEVTNLVDNLIENGKGEKSEAHVDTKDKEKTEDDKEDDKEEKSGTQVDNKDKASVEKDKEDDKEKKIGTQVDIKDKEKMEKSKEDDKEEKNEAHVNGKDKEETEEDKEIDDIVKEEKSETHVNTKEENKMEKDKEGDQKAKENKKKKENDKEKKQKENGKKVKNYEDDSMDDDDKDSMTSKDSWDEEDISTKGGDKYTSSKRSEIPHIIDEVSNSDEDKVETDKSEDDDEPENKSENGEKDESHKEETEEADSGPMKVEDDKEQSGMQESEFGHGHLTEDDVTDDDA